MRYYEDVTIGEAYEHGSYTFDRDEIVSFAEQYDPQPFHIDEDYGQDSMFGSLIASGLHTLSVCNRLATDGVLENFAILGGRGVDELRFLEPVYPDDTLSVEVTVRKKHGIDRRHGRGDVDIQVTGFDENAIEKIRWTALTMIETRGANGN
ncbi:MaoC/PaaZ C-terminal domain-containing protein [Natronomonas amylolytica]|uniref:MaoC/PaaZ C-terminal domain-containing protein n=1 Tax=Natronomonas amylolytica TaxID=3108498 RepID=UPI0030098E5E